MKRRLVVPPTAGYSLSLFSLACLCLLSFLIGVAVSSGRLPPSRVRKETVPSGRNENLHRLLDAVADPVTHTVLAAMSNSNLVSSDGAQGQLGDWVRRVKAAGIRNFVVFALDQHTKNAMIRQDVPVHLVQPKELAIVGGHNHAASAQKYHILKMVLDEGFNIMLSDTDIVFFQDPFMHFQQDCDLSASSDGHTLETVYGKIDGDDDPDMGWSRYSQAWRIHAFNAGLFYLRSNERTRHLVENIHNRLVRENVWDQTAFNLYVSAPVGSALVPEKRLPITSRVLDPYLFINSKTLFKHIRNTERDKNLPVCVHINYHPDKGLRLNAVEQHFVYNKSEVYFKLPVGSQ